jgi:hypothetical protein
MKKVINKNNKVNKFLINNINYNTKFLIIYIKIKKVL